MRAIAALTSDQAGTRRRRTAARARRPGRWWWSCSAPAHVEHELDRIVEQRTGLGGRRSDPCFTSAQSAMWAGRGTAGLAANSLPAVISASAFSEVRYSMSASASSG